jgi:thymidylate synthase
MLESFDSATMAIFHSLQELRRDGCKVEPIIDKTSIGSFFGRQPRRTVELIGNGFVLSNPRARIVNFKARPLNFAFAIANVLWTILGDDDLSMISFYNDKARAFSPDGNHLVGSIGKRIFAYGQVNQFAEAVQRLSEDAQSRRAVIQIFSPSDLVNPPLDTPCSTSFQLMIRDGQLHWITYMRSQSAAMVMPYDLFLFTMLQEAAALTLRVSLGRYYHFCGSIHYYEDEGEIVERIVGETPKSSVASMNPMKESPLAIMDRLRAAEQSIRNSLTENVATSIALDGFGLPSYWVSLLEVLIISMKKRFGQSPSSEDFAKLPEAFRIV